MNSPGAAGMLLLNKPAGMTSHDAVVWLRRGLGVRRIGHAGTLDPLASGLLPLLVGPTTRLVAQLHAWPKTYVGLIALGRETVTGDFEGVEPLDWPTVPVPPAAVLRAATEQLTGRLLQSPPAFSAKKIGGQPAHRLARQGRPPVLPPTAVTIFRLRLAPRPPGRLAFAARVSSGTYLRVLARDVGRLTGAGACLASLRRTGIGPLRVRDALIPRPGLARETILAHLRPPEQIPLPLPTVRLLGGAVGLFRRGQPTPGAPTLTGPVRVVSETGLEGLADISPEGWLQPRVVLTGDPPTGAGAPDAAWRVAEGDPRG